MAVDFGNDVDVITIAVPGAMGPAGPIGPIGPANSLVIGTVTTLASGASATAGITGTAPNQTLNLGIPTGPTPTITSTSATSLAIGTGTKVFTTTAGIAWAVGQVIRASSRANTANFMVGTITAYSGTSLTLNVTSVGGSGTFADWNLSLTGDQGPTGTPGTTPVMTTTSATSQVIATGSKVFTTAAALTYVVGNVVRIWNTANAAQYMIGTVTAIAGTSLTVNVTEIAGTGTFTTWTISLTGTTGATGPTGLTGPANTLVIGTVTTGAPGSSAVASVTGTAPNQTLNLTLPQGAQGPTGSGAVDATSTIKGSVQLAGDFGGTAALPTVVSGANHNHTSAQISDSTAVGRSVLTAVDAPTARTALGTVATTLTLTAGAGLTGGGDLSANRTFAVAYGSAANTAVQGNDTRVTADQAIGTASIRTLGTGAQQAAAGNHTHTSAGISDSTAVGRSILTAVDANAVRTAAAAAPLLSPTATKTAAYTVVANELAIMNVAGGATALTLPAAPVDKTVIGFRALGATTATPLTVTRGGTATIGDSGATSVTEPMSGVTRIYQYNAATTAWFPIADVKPLASLDTRFAATTHTHVATTDLTATGTKDVTTFLRGDNTWAVPPGAPTFANIPAGSTITVLKSGATWPARPTARTDVIVAWKGADPSPAIVTTGTGGMLDGTDYRLVTP